jgi:hypothetical protein
MVLAEQLKPELLFFGKLEHLELIPLGRVGCPDPSKTTEHFVVVTNACGCGIASFSVDIPVVPSNLSDLKVQYGIGEWCRSRISLSNRSRFLVYQAPNQREASWVEALDTETGELGFIKQELEYLAYELHLNLKELEFGPERTDSCMSPNYEPECSHLPVILVQDLIERLHITNRSSRSARTR